MLRSTSPSSSGGMGTKWLFLWLFLHTHLKSYKFGYFKGKSVTRPDFPQSLEASPEYIRRSVSSSIETTVPLLETSGLKSLCGGQITL